MKTGLRYDQITVCSDNPGKNIWDNCKILKLDRATKV